MSQEGLLRLGFVQLRVLNMAEAITHYVDRIGLEFVSKEADGRVYLKAYDEFYHHSVILRETDHAGLDLLAFKADSKESIEKFRQRIKAWGLTVKDIPAGEQPATGERIAFIIPTGHRFEIYCDMELSENGPETINPFVWKSEPKGMRAQRLDHALLYGPNLDKTEEFFTKILDFHVPERVDLPDRTLAIWMTVSNKAHDIAFVEHADPAKLHHIAFFIENWDEIGHAADIISRYDISRDVGPTRHGITRGQTIYFFDPSGNRNEVFCGGYAAYKDHPTRVWDSDTIGRGIFYYERQLNDAFLTVVT